MINKFLLKIAKKIFNKYSFQNDQMIICYNDNIGTDILFYGYYEKSLLDSIIKKFPKELSNTTFLDVGANIGNHSIYFSNFFKNIICFEPQIKTFKVLQLNINDLPNVKAYNHGLNSKRIKVDFNIPYKNSGMGNKKNKNIKNYKEKVELKPFPENEKDTVGYIKIDVEGDELKVLESLKNKISLDLPIISFEINDNNKNRNKLISYFTQLGYDTFYISLWSKYQKNILFRMYYSICGDQLIKVSKDILINESYNFTLVTTFNPSSNYKLIES
jgi:FkbM family methyltransferase